MFSAMVGLDGAEVQPRFNQEGVEAERAHVQGTLVPRWEQQGWEVQRPAVCYESLNSVLLSRLFAASSSTPGLQVTAAIDRLWAGERDLDTLCEGADDNSMVLIGLILTADSAAAAKAARKMHRKDAKESQKSRRAQVRHQVPSLTVAAVACRGLPWPAVACRVSSLLPLLHDESPSSLAAKRLRRAAAVAAAAVATT